MIWAAYNRTIYLPFTVTPGYTWVMNNVGLIKQITQYEYDFYSMYHEDVIDWLMNDCIWNYVVYSRIEHTLFGKQTRLKFKDVRGAVEFKLRFV